MSSSPTFRIDLLANHDRTDFSCRSEPLDRYLKTRAGQDMRRRLATCFVAVSLESNAVAGYYTVSASRVALMDIPENKSFGRYEDVPAALLGRLAVDVRFQGKGLGRALLYDSIIRILRGDLAAALLIVEAKDDSSATFYQRNAFLRFCPDGRKFYLPLKDAAKLFPPKGA